MLVQERPQGLRNQTDKRSSEYAKDLRVCWGGGEEELSKPSYKASVLNATSQYCYPIFHLKETESLDFDKSNSFQNIFDYYALYLLAPSKYGAMSLG